ncbi:MAG: hypothetical protein ACOX50_02435 [Patescibacteria group bacterium]|jgi:4-amino-4-deoxy-L-arabinose transferase-like glycosyltransferase
MRLTWKTLVQIGLIVVAFFYYVFFLNKGIVLYDEGYYVHLSERILQGETPFQDFFTNYSPGYFYLLAGLFKVFGPHLLVGRIVNLFVCLGIIAGCFYILKLLKADSFKHIILSFLLLVSFGFPLVNISHMNWLGVLGTEAIVILYLFWLTKQKKLYLLLGGFVLGLMVFFKHNVGLPVALATNFLVFVVSKSFKEKLLSSLWLNFGLVLITLAWFLPIFGKEPSLIFVWTNWLANYHSAFPASFPPLSFLFQPLGVFKLLPYYWPIILAITFIPYFFSSKRNFGLIAFCLLPTLGLAVSIYPASDLLHLYPFLALCVIAFLTYHHLEKSLKPLLFVTTLVLIGIGFYLSIFREYYRYDLPYRNHTTPLSMPRAKGILTEAKLAQELTLLYEFIDQNSEKNEPIVVYPFSPLIYFLTDRPNASSEPIFYPRFYAAYPEEKVLAEMQKKKVRYIVASGEYTNDSLLSEVIQELEIAKDFGHFKVFTFNGPVYYHLKQ